MDNSLDKIDNLHDKLYNPTQQLIHTIGLMRAKKSNELIEKNIPSWKTKLLKKYPKFCKRIKYLGYSIEIFPCDKFESDVVREKLVLKRRGKIIAEDIFFVKDQREGEILNEN